MVLSIIFEHFTSLTSLVVDKVIIVLYNEIVLLQILISPAIVYIIHRTLVLLTLVQLYIYMIVFECDILFY